MTKTKTPTARPKVFNWFNAEKRPDHRRKTYPPSKTIPDQTMPIRELLERYARGLPINGTSQEPIYNGEDSSGIDPRSLDLTDRQEIIQKGIEIERSRQTPPKDEKTDSNTVREDDSEPASVNSKEDEKSS